jgi:NAD(P)-dependent dehydrogenase (short-subunit alcohol dehydrogenase family)
MMPDPGRGSAGPITLVVRSDSTIGRAAVRRFEAEGARVHPADEETCLRGAAVRECVDAYGGLDVLVIAPADAVIQPFPRASLADHRTSIHAGLRTTFFIAQDAVRAMGRDGRIGIAAPPRPEGIADDVPAPATIVEGGLIALVRLLAVELAPDGIAVNALCPIASHADPDLVAAGLAFLASADASYVSGAFVPMLG